MTEIDIIDGLKGNDRLVFDRVFEEFFPQIQFFAARLIGDHEEANDIVIRAFQSMWGLKVNFETLNTIVMQSSTVFMQVCIGCVRCTFGAYRLIIAVEEHRGFANRKA